MPCGDTTTTSTRLDTLLSHPDKLLEMGKQGRQHVEQHYSLQREAEALCRFLTSLQERYAGG